MKKKLLAIIFICVATLTVTIASNTTFEAKTVPVRLNKSKIGLTIKKNATGKTTYGKTTLKVKVTKGYKIKSKSFKTSKKSVATVSKKGVVVAKKKGTAKIYVTVKYTKSKNKKVYTKKITAKVTVAQKNAPAETNKPVETPTTKPAETPTQKPAESTKPFKIEGLHSAYSPAPKKSEMQYIKTINLGAEEKTNDVNEEVNAAALNDGVVGEIYLMNVPGKDKIYTMYIKTVKEGTKMAYTSHGLAKMFGDEFGWEKTELACVVFENKVVTSTCSRMFEQFMINYAARGNKYLPDYPYGIYNMENLDTSQVEDFSNMFYDAFQLKGTHNFYLPEGFDTSSAVDMSSMFYSFGSHESVDNTLTLPSTFDTKNVKYFISMFGLCHLSKVTFPKKFVFNTANGISISGFFTDSKIKYIENETPFDTTGIDSHIGIPCNGTYETMKDFVDQLDFSALAGAGLMLCGNQDTQLINYVLDKIATEATNTLSFMNTCRRIVADDIIADFEKCKKAYCYEGFFGYAKANSVTIKNANILEGNNLFEQADIGIIDISTCTFAEGGEFDGMFDRWRGKSAPIIYVKDEAMQAFIIEKFNACDNGFEITASNVIIKK